jgi:hypothetical protein
MDQSVENKTFLIDIASEPMLRSGDGDDNLG